MSKTIEDFKILGGVAKIVGAAGSAAYTTIYHIKPDDINNLPEPYRTLGHFAYAGLILGGMFSLGSGFKDIAYSIK